MVAVEVRQGTLGADGRGWGPAGNTWHGYSRLRSGREHWAWMVVVEVRQGALGVGGRGWGPAENTVDRGSQLSKDDEDDEDDEDEEDDKDDKDDKEDEEEEEEEEEERRTRQEEAEEEEEATDIKSNNPHLAGGEKHPEIGLDQEVGIQKGMLRGSKAK